MNNNELEKTLYLNACYIGLTFLVEKLRETKTKNERFLNFIASIDAIEQAINHGMIMEKEIPDLKNNAERIFKEKPENKEKECKVSDILDVLLEQVKIRYGKE
mgnify:CR=1 FL=1